MIETIISGGQTGVDQAALDAAIAQDIDIGGWCPQGRLNENGKLSSTYNKLEENIGIFQTEQDNYNARTIRNIMDSDGTLILVPQIPLPSTIKDGTLLTIAEVARQNKPYLLIDVLSENSHEAITTCLAWIQEHDIHILNAAGPRESSWPGIYQKTYDFLSTLCITLKETAREQYTM